MEKKIIETARPNQQMLEGIKGWGFVNLVFLVLSFVGINGERFIGYDVYKLYFVLVSCIIIFIDILVGFIVSKFIKTKHKTLFL